jgi:hypothetical protein
LTFNRLHSIVSQKIVLFITTTVRISREEHRLNVIESEVLRRIFKSKKGVTGGG